MKFFVWLLGFLVCGVGIMVLGNGGFGYVLVGLVIFMRFVVKLILFSCVVMLG